ncbi:MAG TPA: NADH-quinone oxidoreductase subunit M [Pseudomonadota bacterium]|nr:NADH-quinone oxidoreductase subunit M [Pseudomonadota bacterium]
MSMILPILTFLPLLGALVCLLVPREEAGLHRGIGLFTSLVTFAASLMLLPSFEPAKMSYVVRWPWAPSLGIEFHLGIDGISLWLVMLTTFLLPVVFLSTWTAITEKVREFVVCALVLQTGMLGAFLALDLFLFYVMWEVMLVPMYFIIGIWGGDRRLYASIKFVIYTMVGSLLMLIAILFLYIKGHEATGVWSFDYDNLRKLVLTSAEQKWCFAAFALAFCIKVPLFPLHTWLPDAHVEAPTAGSVILASVLLKFGPYGLIRFAMPMFPQALLDWGPMLSLLAVIGIVYGSLVAYAQTDIKKLIAYSSVAHMGFVVLGLMMLNSRGVNGALYQCLAHGISTGALFLSVGVIYERRHTRRMEEFGGLWQRMPVFAAFLLIFTMASIGLPGLSGFVGEFLIIIGTFSANKAGTGMPQIFEHATLLAALAASGVVFGAIYMLSLFQRVMLGPLENPLNRKLRDLSGREIWVLLPMLAMAFWLGICPKTFLKDIDPAVSATLSQIREKFAAGPSEGKPYMLGGGDKAKATPGKDEPNKGNPPAAAGGKP